MRMFVSLANSADPDEILHYAADEMLYNAAFPLGLHFMGIQNEKG